MLKDMATKPTGDAKTKLLDAGVSVIRANGYAAATVDEICRVAGVTKGAFFHHFASKDEFAVATAEHFAPLGHAQIMAAPYHKLSDPVDRLLGYLEFRKTLLHGDLSEYTCLYGTMVQEAYETHPPIREACDRAFRMQEAMLAADISAAIELYDIDGDWTAESLALHIQAVTQGALILAKAQHGPAVAVACIDHLLQYVELLFDRGASRVRPGRRQRAEDRPTLRRHFGPPDERLAVRATVGRSERSPGG
jgi:TetR/AcrR family transcriptional regulator, transcriptional repressor for nem operon